MAESLPRSIRFGRAVLGDLDQAERREWWLSNGRGAYAAGTLAGTLTRRYHGLLIAPLRPPLGRHLLLSKADAVLVADGSRRPLHSNRWASGALAPAGHLDLESFHLEGRMPVWVYAFGDLRVEQRIWLEPGVDAVCVAWRAHHPGAARDLRLEVSLLANDRDHHGQTEPGAFRPRIEAQGDTLALHQPEGAASGPYTLGIRAHGGCIAARDDWYHDFDLPLERERGLSDRDHHLCVGMARLHLNRDGWCGLRAGLDRAAGWSPDASMEGFLGHDLALLREAPAETPEWIARLRLAADSFVVARPLPDEPEGLTVIAGYPWFGDWGRDSMIALPGLSLATGRPRVAHRILRTYARFVDGGMLPNVFPEDGQPARYNTVDAALWYVEAWRAYAEATCDLAALDQALPVLEDIVRRYHDGTRHGIAADPDDGLLRAGEPGVQLTWMDARVGDWVVTPRIGKPVEINALWYNALCILAGIAARRGLRDRPYGQWARQARVGFQRYRMPDGSLYDLLDGPDGDDPALRPNQILAISLPWSPLHPAHRPAVLERCGRALLTSYGLRSLTPDHPAYRGRYLGDMWQRDGAYHQGPVWTWLLGHYALAHCRVYGDADTALGLLEPLRDHLCDAALGTLGEIFDGDPPHTPRGAPAQAWSVATALEAWWRLHRARAGNPLYPPEGGDAAP